ncbi:MAG: OmpA family protein [Pedobacter sp.]|nr:OmpA family protein [Pedobacter sp.]
MKLTRIALAAMLAPLAMCAQAEVTFTPMATYHLFDSDKKDGLEDTVGYALGLGYRFTPAWGVEVHYGRTEPEFEVGGGDGRDSRLTLDGYYAFNAAGSFSPYILVGGGQENQKYDGDDNFESTIANAAIGAFWRFNEYVALRAEVRDVYNFDIESNDQIVGLGIEFSGADGGSSKADSTPEPQPEPQQIEEAAAAVAPVAAAVVDSDGDGVADVADKCSDSPAGVQVDADGCPLDGDKDGVPDYRDQCPTTAAGVVVDDKGCDKVLTEAINKQLSVTFDSGKVVVKDQYKAEIGEVAALLKQYPGTSAEIQGHTDSSGKKASNDKLSQQRADAVKAVLVNEFGVDASRVSAKGYGSSQPVADNKTAEGKAQNRRVIAIISGEAKKVQKKK